MTYSVARLPPGAEDQLPLDVATMRAGAQQILAEDGDLPSPRALDTHVLAVRGQLMLAIPEVEIRAVKLPKGYSARESAVEGIGEARRRLNTEPGHTLPGRIAHAQRLARSVVALCDHYEALG